MCSDSVNAVSCDIDVRNAGVVVCRSLVIVVVVVAVVEIFFWPTH